MVKAQRFQINIADSVLEDLHQRLSKTRFAPDLDNDNWQYGVPTEEIRHWVSAWQNFDWRTAEAKINRYEHYRTEIDGLPIHFLYHRGKAPNPTPIILTHGWPWTFWDWHATIEPLSDPEAFGGNASDAFDVVIPSLPGFAFSTPLVQSNVNTVRTANIWLKLMLDVLGYKRFAAAGGDMGNVVTAQLGHAHAEHLIGIHLLGAVPLTFKLTSAMVAGLEWNEDWGFEKPEILPSDPVLASLPTTPGAPPSSHRLVHVREPQTLAAALHDSPAGMLAWLLKARRFWSDNSGDVLASFSEEFLLTTFSIYWFTECLWSSIRMYRSGADKPWQPSHNRHPIVEAPTGLTFFEYDQTSRSRFWAADYYNLIRTSYSSKGGHFSPSEVPEVVVSEIRETFRQLRN